MTESGVERSFSSSGGVKYRIVAMNVTANAIFSINTSTTVLVDATASWDVNEYVGQLLSCNQLVQ
jgi:hypothetical protein